VAGNDGAGDHAKGDGSVALDQPREGGVLLRHRGTGSRVGWAELAKPNDQRLTAPVLLGFVPQPNLHEARCSSPAAATRAVPLLVPPYRVVCRSPATGPRSIGGRSPQGVDRSASQSVATGLTTSLMRARPRSAASFSLARAGGSRAGARRSITRPRRVTGIATPASVRDRYCGSARRAERDSGSANHRRWGAESLR